MNEAILNMKVGQLGLSVRATNGLKNSGCTTVRDILAMSKAHLVATSNLGKVSLKEIENKLVELEVGRFIEVETTCHCCKGSGKIKNITYHSFWGT